MDGSATGRQLAARETLRHGKVGNWSCVSDMLPATIFSATVALLAYSMTMSAVLAAVSFFGALIFYIGTPIALAVRNITGRLKIQSASEEARRVLLDFSGGSFETLDCSATFVGARCLGTGIGWNGRSLFVLDKGEAFEVPLSLVRQWRWVVKEGNLFATYGSVDHATRMDVAVTNNNEAARAYQASGLFLDVSDVEHPVLQFTCSDRRTLERWSELLRQVCDTRAAEEAAAAREGAEAQVERDRIAALPSVQGIRLGMGLEEAETMAGTAYDRAEDAGGGRRFVRDDGDVLTVEADGAGRVASVRSVQTVEGSRAAIQASLERKYGPTEAVRNGRLEFAAASRDGQPAQLWADLQEEGERIRLTVTLALVPEVVPGLRL